LQFVKLKPTNSFYRRVQHQKIVDSGFESSSVGEGADRAVQVTRKG
jgi:predicted RNA-binding protein Jag